jgi:hypothetical protein
VIVACADVLAMGVLLTALVAVGIFIGWTQGWFG